MIGVVQVKAAKETAKSDWTPEPIMQFTRVELAGGDETDMVADLLVKLYQAPTGRVGWTSRAQLAQEPLQLTVESGFKTGGHAQLRLFAHTIRELMSPSKSFEAKYPCPVCGHTAWGNRINGGSMWPIEIRYDLTDDGLMGQRTRHLPQPQVRHRVDGS